MKETDRIRVYVRFKPTSDNIHRGSARPRELSPNHYRIHNNSQSLDIIPQKIQRQSISSVDIEDISSQRSTSFSFNHIFPPQSSQSDIFNLTVLPILSSLTEGYNSTIICYGQTGSGKTYTMMGDNESDQNTGIIPRLFDHIFHQIENAPITSQYTIALSYFEIYNDSIKDLLNPQTDSSDIYIREINNSNFGMDKYLNGNFNSNPVVYVEGLDKIYVANMNDIQQVITLGNSNRKVADTKMNNSSSRSHSILRVEISVGNTANNNNDNNENKNGTEIEAVYKSTLFLVDLAGSERIYKSGTNSSDVTLKETIGINSSLSALGNVINSLVSDNKLQHIPYRDSKLTRVLQNSLGGNSKTAMIINCSSDADDLNETLSSLRFAQRAKDVRNVVSMNKSIVENKEKVESGVITEKSNVDQDIKSWKSKYVNALKKIVQLETDIELLSANKNLKELNDLIVFLKAENLKLKDENKVFKQSFKDLQNDTLNETIDFRLKTSMTIRSLDSLKSDTEIYKKLLVSKTDKILQLEDEIEDIKNDENSKSRDNKNNFFQESTLNTIKKLSGTIQLQNNELLQQVEKSGHILTQKEQKLKLVNDKLAQRDITVSAEQTEIQKKLFEMNDRLQRLKEKEKEISYAQDSDKNDINMELDLSGTKKGLNLRIVKPR